MSTKRRNKKQSGKKPNVQSETTGVQNSKPRKAISKDTKQILTLLGVTAGIILLLVLLTMCGRKDPAQVDVTTTTAESRAMTEAPSESATTDQTTEPKETTTGANATEQATTKVKDSTAQTTTAQPKTSAATKEATSQAATTMAKSKTTEAATTTAATQPATTEATNPVPDTTEAAAATLEAATTAPASVEATTVYVPPTQPTATQPPTTHVPTTADVSTTGRVPATYATTTAAPVTEAPTTQARTTSAIEGHTHYFTSTVTKEASCTAEGARAFACSCGHGYTEAIPALGHEWKEERVMVKDAWDEKVLVKAAYDEEVVIREARDENILIKEGKDAWDEQILVKEAWTEDVMESHAFCRHEGCEMDITEYLHTHSAIGGLEADNLTMTEAGKAWAKAHAESHGADGTELMFKDVVVNTIQREAEYEVIHHEAEPAEYEIVHHEAEVETVHHEAEYETIYHEAEYKVIAKCTRCGETK